uniref:Protocadherin-16 n=1 Tax=Astatotilapia calliptera TaxID=8154 RepID=A0AAX7TEQ5_ASTCA
MQEILIPLLLLNISLIAVHSPVVLGTLELQLDEEQPAGTIVGDISAGLPPGVTASLYFISDHEGTGVGSDLDIDESTGIIKTAKVLDRELRDRYNFIAVTMTGVTVEVTIKVNDINDHAPKFPRKQATFKIPEQTAIGTRFPLEPAVDSDKGQLTTQGYLIKDGNVGQAFTLETRRGSNEVLYLDLVVNTILDREKRSTYTLSLEAFDGGSPKRTDQMTLDITVQDINDNAPVFNQSRYHAIISENLQPGSNILQVFATDVDEGDNGMVLYEINRRQSDPDCYFVIDSRTGIITLNKPLDFEMRRVHELVVQAQDNATHPEVTNAFVTIHVRDYNDNQPTMTIIFLSEDGSPRISEGAQPGQYVARISVTDPDYGEYANVNVSLEGGDGKFALTTKDSIIYLICVDQILDREERDTYELRVMATDSGMPPLRAESSFTIQVIDINDNPPLFDQPVYRQVIPEVVFPGSFVLQVTARDKDQGPNGDISYSILQDGSAYYSWFSIDSITGIITTLSQLDYEKNPSPSITVVATDGGKPSLSSTAVVNIFLQDINDNEPVFERNFYNVSVEENTAPGTCFGHVLATDRDSGPNGRLAYRFLLILISNHINMHIYTKKVMKQSCESLEHLPTSQKSSVCVYERVSDCVRTDLHTVHVYYLCVTDQSRLALKTHHYSSGLVPVHKISLIYLLVSPGEISTRMTLDREQQSTYQLLVVAQDGGSPPRSATGTAFITVLDENDNDPVFIHSQSGKNIIIQVMEGQPSGVVLGTLQAKDPDEGENGTIFYSLSGPRAERFSLNTNTGELRSSSPLSHSERAEYTLTVTATDRGLPPRSTSCSLTIQVRLVERTPATKKNSLSITFNSVEEAKPGSVIGSVRLHDRGTLEDDKVTYTVVGGTDRDGTFVVDRLTGDVYLARPLDYERDSRYNLQIEVDDFSEAPPSSTLVHLDIDIEDSNDHTPQFPEDPITIVISESMDPGSSVYTFQATDKDGSGSNSKLVYSILQQWPNTPGLLTLDPSTGVLSLGQKLDYEVTPNLILVVKATDSAPDVSQRRWGSVTARLYVTDENDNPPVFISPTAVSVMEDQPVGFVVLYVMARDADQGENGRVTYRIQSGNTAGTFSLNPSTGSLSIFKPLDREEQDIFNLTVIAEDHGIPQHSSIQLLCVHVIDVNDEAPWFEQSQYEVEISENQPPGTSVLTVSATDLDQGSNGQVTYDGISQEGFSINPVSGVIMITKSLDRELQEYYTVTVSAKDGGLPPNYAKATVRIKVTDVNDNAPVFGRLYYSIEVPENLEALPLFTLRATDQDAGDNGRINYKITAGDSSGDFRLDGQSGVLSTSRPLDREKRPGYSLTVIAQDQGHPALSSTATVEVIVLDINDHSPQFQSSSYTAEILEDVPIGSLVLEVKAIDLDHGPNSQVLYFLSHGSQSMFMIDQNTGRIITASPLDRERTASYTFEVCATDSSPANPRNSTAQVTIYIQDVNDNAPFFIQDPLIVNVSASSVSNRRVLATMRAEDKDFGANGSVFYRFANSVRGFTINSLTGEIQATEKLQTMTQSQRTLIVQAMDQGNPAQSSLGVVIIYIKEQSYSGIRFSRTARDVSLQENAAKGTVVTQAQAQYPDGSKNGITYSIFSGNKLQSFGINTITGEIWVQKSEGLDFEETPKLRLVVKAETASSSSYMAVNLILQDVNDNLPRFQLQNYVAYIREAQGYDFPIIQVAADDRDQGQNGQVTYSIRSSSMSGLFKIDPLTGSVTTAAIMDREIWTQTKLVVTATDRGTPRLAGSATLTVIIIDLNDNSPMIPLPQKIRVPEDTLIGTIITQVTGNDVDSGPALSYTLHLDASSQGMFGIHCYGGGVSLTGPLDYEERTWYTLTVRTSDSKHQSEANLTVLVDDVNDNSPTFTQDLYQVAVSEHLPAGSAVVTVTATDRDSGDNGKITYRVMSSTKGVFYIDPVNGTLFTKQKTEFDFENPSILVVIEARDQGTPSLSAIATVHVQVSDINDNAPIFHQSEYRATVSEDGLPGSTVLTLEAVDGDLLRDNCGFDFAIASGNSGNAFQIESSVRFLEGRGFQTVGSLILVEKLDFEAVPSYNLTVVVSDRGIPQRSSSVPIIISVTDANDNPPVFSRTEYSVILSEGTAAGTEILHLSATDPDSAPNSEVQYSISSGDETDLFHVDQWTGALRLQRPLNSETQLSHLIVVQATDGQGHFALAPVSIEVKDINDNRPFFPLNLVTASIRENQPQNALVTMLHAIDHDRGVFGQLRYYMLDSFKEGKEGFFINHTSGEIRTRSSFDFEKINSFQFVVMAVDAGNYSATVTVKVYVTGEDEYDPVFTSSEFLFEVPEGAKKGQVIGKVQARDEDGGVDGVVLYSLADHSPYFEVNKSTGEVSLKTDGYSRHMSRSKRELRLMTLDVSAHSPLETSRISVAKVTLDVTHTSFGLTRDVNMLLVSVIAVSLGIIVILITIAVALFFVKLRRRKKEKKTHERTPMSGTLLHKFEETKLAANEMIYHQALPGYATDQRGTSGGPYTRGGSLDPSHSSGRGSAEAEAAEDDEIRMINEYPRVSSISSSMQEHISARGPDSGIQQDADQLSDVSCEPSIDWFKGKKAGSVNSTLLAGQVPIYRDEGCGYVGVGRGLSISRPKDYTFPEDGKPSADGSLTAIVASDEELRGSYNWDYLLNWCPQFQPLANVFTEIARLKDETAPPHPRRSFHHKAKAESRIDPPPLITSVAHPGAKTVHPKPAVGRTFPNLASLRRSPISAEGSISSIAMSPSFSPSLSPLAARSPAITPFSVSQGPSASVISTTEHNLEHSEEAELRI